MSLAERAARGGSITVSVQLVKFVVQLLGLVVLGRILSPSDYGLLAMVTAVVGIGQVLRDFGLSSAAIQARTLSRGQASNLFWINLGVGVTLGVLCYALAPEIAALYGDNRIRGIAGWLAVTFLFTGAQTQVEAHITREMRYVALSVSDLTVQVCSLLVAIALALLGAGYWALVYQVVFQAIALFLLRSYLAGWIPGRPSRSEPMRALFRYGANLAATQILVYISSNIDSVLVGSRFGATALGWYGRAYQILALPLNQMFSPLTAVALPVLSRLQDDRPRYELYLRRAQLLVGYPAVFLFVMLGCAADPLIKTVFGGQWEPSAPLFQIMAIGGVFQSVNYVAYWVFLSLGITRSHFRYSLLSRSFLILCLFIGVTGGPRGVAIGYTVATIAAWPLALVWLRGSARLRVSVLMPGALRILAVGATGLIVGFGVGTAFSQSGDLIQLALFLLVPMSMAGVMLGVSPLRRDLRSCLETAKTVFTRSDGLPTKSADGVV